MSISPFEPDERPLPWRSSSASQSDKTTPKADPLTLSQALTITAGMAGLIGLLSGVAMRFSLANSSNARFLSPLQTFPALSNWSPQLPQSPGRSESLSGEALSGEAPRERWESELDEAYRDSADAQLERSEPTDPAAYDFISVDSFDEFADRKEGTADVDGPDPWETLRRGPSLSDPDADVAPFDGPAIAADESGETFDNEALDPVLETEWEAEEDYFGSEPFTDFSGSDFSGSDFGETRFGDGDVQDGDVQDGDVQDGDVQDDDANPKEIDAAIAPDLIDADRIDTDDNL
ncbi:MAG: hypothetical protein AAFP09_03380 [Cyanobacteria bacterium J06607_10]